MKQNISFPRIFPSRCYVRLWGLSQRVRSRTGLLEQIPVPREGLGSETSDIGGAVGRIAVFEILISNDQDGATVTILSPQYYKHQGQITAWISSYKMTLGECAQHFKHQISVFEGAILPRPKKSVLISAARARYCCSSRLFCYIDARRYSH